MTLASRYERNIGTVGADGQERLSRARVAVVGCGGLGGFIVELLSRAGVGNLVVVDGDVFSESNLNRQLLCTENNLGQNKAQAAADRVGGINSSVDVRVFPSMLNESNAREILEGCEIVFDALDSLSSRVILCHAADALGIKIIHGAIAGWWGQIAVIEPGDETLTEIWAQSETENGIETQTGNPPWTPALVASLQVAEGIKAILGKPILSAGEMLYIDTLEMCFEKIKLAR